MSDSILRSKLIRLAHANPKMRAHLLPLLKKAARFKLDAPDPRLSQRTKAAEGKMFAERAKAVQRLEGMQDGLARFGQYHDRVGPTHFAGYEKAIGGAAKDIDNAIRKLMTLTLDDSPGYERLY